MHIKCHHKPLLTRYNRNIPYIILVHDVLQYYAPATFNITSFLNVLWTINWTPVDGT